LHLPFLRQFNLAPSEFVIHDFRYPTYLSLFC
jgi:hypothetical protein